MGSRVRPTVGCFPELCFLQFSVAQVRVGLRKQFIYNFVSPTWACAAGFNNNNNNNNNNTILISKLLQLVLIILCSINHTTFKFIHLENSTISSEPVTSSESIRLYHHNYINVGHFEEMTYSTHEALGLIDFLQKVIK